MEVGVGDTEDHARSKLYERLFLVFLCICPLTAPTGSCMHIVYNILYSPSFFNRNIFIPWSYAFFAAHDIDYLPEGKLPTRC